MTIPGNFRMKKEPDNKEEGRWERHSWNGNLNTAQKEIKIFLLQKISPPPNKIQAKLSLE